MIADSRVFITGGAGFIGSTLARQLLDDNEVTVYDNFDRDALSTSGIVGHPRLSVTRGDILDAAALGEAMSGHTHVVHCAAIAGIQTVTKSPVRTMRVNMIGSANVLEAASQVPGIARVVCFSTSEVFGVRAWRSAESDPTTLGAVGESRWTYAVSKLAEEHLAIAYHREMGLPTVVVRPFNVYGPGQVGEGAMRIFIERARENLPITIHGDGSQIRAWCYVDDMVRAVHLALETPAAVGESFNVGNVRAVQTIHGLAETVVRVLGSSSSIDHVPSDSVDVELRVPNISHAERVLGFVAEVGIDEGIARTAAWMAQRGATA